MEEQPMMPEEILPTLTTAGPGAFPRDGLLQAIEQKEALTPLLLDELQQQLDSSFKPALESPNYWRHLFAIYLLAYFREPAAYPIFVAMGALPGETLLDATGDMVTEDYRRHLAAVSHGDLSGIKRLIEDVDLNEYVRSAALGALEVLFHIGELDRDELVEYLRVLANRWLEDTETDNDWVWYTLTRLIIVINAQELITEARKAFELDLVGGLFGRGAENFERAMEAQRKHYEPYQPTLRDGLPGNPAEELADWHCFQPENLEKKYKPPNKPYRPAPIRGGPKVGRNEPCPCGSGKKYKKCCGN